MMGASGSTTKHQRAVGVFPNRRVAEQALYELRDSGFPMERVSVITRDRVRDEDIAGAEVRDSVHDTRRIGNKADEGAAIGAATGGVLGGLTGLLVGLGTLAIPGVGPVLLAGATATTLATTLAGGAIGAATGGLLGALVGLGIPEERARIYHDRVAQGDYLVIVDGTDEQIAVAERILHHRGIEDYGVYDAPAVHTHTPAPTTATAATSATVATTPATPATIATAPVHHHNSMIREHNKHAIGIFPNQQDAEYAIADLRSAGFPLNQVALVARRFDRREPFTGASLYNRFDATSNELAAERNRYYNERLDRGDYLVVVSGNEDDIRRAAAIFHRRGIQDWQLYEPHTTRRVEPRVTEVAPARTVHTVQPAVNQEAHAPVAVPLNRQAIGFFPNRQDAEYAIADLRFANFPLNQVSLIARRFDRRESFAGTDLRDRFDATRYGIPIDRAQYYNDRLDRGDYLVVVNGTEDEIRHAAAVLNRRGSLQDWQLYPPDRSTVVDTPHPIDTARSVEAIRPVETVRPLDTVATVTPGVTSTPVTPSSTLASNTPAISSNRQAIAVFANRQDAETAITELRKAGFPLNHTALIARHLDRREQFAGVDLCDRFEARKYGIPNDWTRYYNDRVNRGNYLVVVTGTETDIRQAETALNPYRVCNWETHTSSESIDRHSNHSVARPNRW